MKFGTQSRSNMLIMNIVLGVYDLEPKIIDPKIEICAMFDAKFQIWADLVQQKERIEISLLLTFANFCHKILHLTSWVCGY